MDRQYFIGIDIGTQGARVVLIDNSGTLISAREETFPLNEGSREEQSPEQWWASCYNSLRALCSEAASMADLKKLTAIGVTSTSGTIIPLDEENRPLHNALMYSDPRSSGQAAICKQAAVAAGIKGYTAFNASSGLPKMLWFMDNYPEKVEDIGKFIHASDYITGKLSGRFGITDYTNALKSGYDIDALAWPAYLTTELPLKSTWLQEVVPSGTPVGTLHAELARDLGLPGDTIITAGMTDGCASQIASGAVNTGDWNTTIGTTLVIKGVTTTEIKDPTGAIYCHRHPEGFWMPGGASNTGADWISKLFTGADLESLNRQAAMLVPTSFMAWPLLQQGERFPFFAPQAKGFAPEGLAPAELFTAYMEGVAYIERYAYERIKVLSGEIPERVLVAGGGSNSDTWLKIRCNVLNVQVSKMKNVSGAAGAAILAASKTAFNSVIEAAASMVQPEKTLTPEVSMVKMYDRTYHQFIQILIQKGYIPG